MSSKTKTTATKEEPTPALVPKLRFPEFRGATGWEPTTLGAVARLKNGYAFKSSEYVDFGPFQIITIANVQQGELSLDATKRIAELPVDIQDHQRLRIGDILISMTGNVGRICRVTCEALLLNQRVGKLMPEAVTPDFFYHSIQREEFRKSMQLKAAGGAQGNLSGGDITEYTLHCPTDEPEQQKIAECLSSVDELIAVQARKLDALKTHKKGLMQQLFPREGETQPRLRFPEFQNAGEWEDQSIGDFGQVVTGSTPSTAQPKFYGGGLPFVSPADISDLRFVDQTKTTLTEEGFAETRPIKAGSVLFVCIGSTIGKVAQNVRDCATNQQINAVVPSSKHSGGFVYFALSLASERIALLAGRQAVPIINKSLFSSVRILAPKLPEQQRIATCLSSLDALITAETQKHEALKTHKKGLMQQLFPSPEEVAG